MTDLSSYHLAKRHLEEVRRTAAETRLVRAGREHHGPSSAHRLMTGVSRRISATVTLRTRRPSVQAGCALEPWAGGGVCAVGVLTVPAGAAWATPTWLAPVDLSAPGQNAGRPQVAVDHAGDAVAVWNRFSGGKEIVQAATRPAGGTSRQHGARRTPEKRSEQLLNNVPRHEPVSVAAFRRIVASVFGPECAYGGLALASVNVVLEAEQ